MLVYVDQTILQFNSFYKANTTIATKLFFLQALAVIGPLVENVVLILIELNKELSVLLFRSVPWLMIRRISRPSTPATPPGLMICTAGREATAILSC